MAEIEKYFRSIFDSNENFKICFRDYLTFKVFLSTLYTVSITAFSFVALRSLVQQIILPVFYYDSLSLTTAHVLALSMPVVLCMSQSFSVFGLRHLEVFLDFLRTRPATPWFQRKSRQK